MSGITSSSIKRVTTNGTSLQISVSLRLRQHDSRTYLTMSDWYVRTKRRSSQVSGLLDCHASSFIRFTSFLCAKMSFKPAQ